MDDHNCNEHWRIIPAMRGDQFYWEAQCEICGRVEPPDEVNHTLAYLRNRIVDLEERRQPMTEQEYQFLHTAICAGNTGHAEAAMLEDIWQELQTIKAKRCETCALFNKAEQYYYCDGNHQDACLHTGYVFWRERE